MKTNLILKSGRVVTRSPMSNGAADASMADGGDMSETEWQEICGLIRKETQKALNAKLRRQARDSAMRDCGLVKVRGAMGGTYWE